MDISEASQVIFVRTKGHDTYEELGTISFLDQKAPGLATPTPTFLYFFLSIAFSTAITYFYFFADVIVKRVEGLSRQSWRSETITVNEKAIIGLCIDASVASLPPADSAVSGEAAAPTAVECPCTGCSASFKDNAQVLAHLQEVHFNSGAGGNEGKGPQFYCGQCGKPHGTWVSRAACETAHLSTSQSQRRIPDLISPPLTPCPLSRFVLVPVVGHLHWSVAAVTNLDSIERWCERQAWARGKGRGGSRARGVGPRGQAGTAAEGEAEESDSESPGARAEAKGGSGSHSQDQGQGSAWNEEAGGGGEGLRAKGLRTKSTRAEAGDARGERGRPGGGWLDGGRGEASSECEPLPPCVVYMDSLDMHDAREVAANLSSWLFHE
jgi:hypothetical protein